MSFADDNSTAFDEFVFLLFNFNLAGPLGLSSVGLLAASFLLVAANFGPRFHVRSEIGAVFAATIFVLWLIGLIGTGHLLRTSSTVGEWNSVLGWFLLTVSFLVGWTYQRQIFGQRFANGCAIASIIVSTLVVVYVLQRAQSVSSLRYDINSVLPGGINGFLYGLFALQAFYWFNRSNTGLLASRSFRVVGIVAPLTAGLALGSRQYLGGVLVFSVLVSLINSPRIRDTFVGLLKGLFLVAVLIIAALQVDLLRDLISARLLNTLRQIDAGSGRLEKIKALIEEQDTANLLGYGPGSAQELLGARADSFYLEFALDYGNTATALLTFLFVVILLRTAPISWALERRTIDINVWAFVTVTVIWFAQFNEIIREHFLWMIIGALLSRRSDEGARASMRLSG